jgi:acetone carboxylase gamma subunit
VNFFTGDCPSCGYQMYHEATDEEAADGVAEFICPVPDCGTVFEVELAETE